MNSAEIGCLILFLTAFIITVFHPFIIGTCIVSIFVFIRYFAPDSVEKISANMMEPEYLSRSQEEIQLSKNVEHSSEPKQVHLQRHHSEDVELSSEPEHALKVVEEKNKKSQREILEEIREAEEREKYSKLLLTYQVPSMTAYYESLVQIMQN
ncbi:hypothetical protein DICVIV_13553 [Dictyocaulus viviparus]|uniref:Uncharacterized protein n=1 Tax=Dictyocaulus viviparus TaxID=29172 RepID=A0A0D8X9N8_DICVI|nr:hypothetical protein DICVIV_13553 [Dictyocaulus viviparus]